MTEVLEIERKAVLSPEQISARRRAMDADVWLFIKWICGHGADDIERFHRPLAYFLAGDAVRLAAALNTYDSEVVTQIRSDLEAREVDWNTKRGIRDLKGYLQRVNNRISRSMGKTSIGLDCVLWAASVNPNISIGIASKSDPAAWAMCDAIGTIMRAEVPLPGAIATYRTFYAERFFPTNPDSQITMKWIQMYGRNAPHQKTIEARGVTSQWYSKHYNVIYCDDLVSTEAKQGEATVADAITFIASFHGITIAERWGGTRYVFNGTIQGPNDDHAAISSNPDYMSLVIPIWRTKSGSPWTLSNMMEDGVPTLPELYSVAACRTKRRDTLANEGAGAVSWLQNFLMCAHESGAMQFTAELLRRSRFVWVKHSIQVGESTVSSRLIRRYLWNADGSPKTAERFAGKQCLCWMKCPSDLGHAYVEFDPLQLERVLAIDQAISEKATADKWSIAVVCQDPMGFKYALKGRADRGYRKMIPAIPLVFSQWGGMHNPPRKVGIESNAWQEMTADWMQRAGEFAFLARHIVKVSPGKLSKDIRIFNNVLANLEMGMLLLDPEDVDRDTEMLKYNGAAENPEDNILDSISIGVTLFGRPAEAYDDYAAQADARRSEQSYLSSVDPETHIDLSNDFMDAVWN